MQTSTLTIFFSCTIGGLCTYWCVNVRIFVIGLDNYHTSVGTDTRQRQILIFYMHVSCAFLFIYVLFSLQFTYKLKKVNVLGDRTRGLSIVGAVGSTELRLLLFSYDPNDTEDFVSRMSILQKNNLLTNLPG